MLTIDETIAQFPEMLHKKAYRLTEEEKCLDAIDRAVAVKMTRPGAAYDVLRKRQSKLLVALGWRYIAALFSKHYPILDNKLFEMPRYLKMRQNNGSYNRWDFDGIILEDRRSPFQSKPKRDSENKRLIYGTGTLFAVGEIDFSDSAIRGEVANIPFGYRNTIRVTAELPGMITDEHMVHYNLAKQRYHHAFAECYSMPKIADIFSLYQSEWWAENERPDLKVMWIPRTDSLMLNKEIRPQPGDPAMILRFETYNFLVHMWNVEGEDPFEHLIREFSIGELPEFRED